MRPIKPPASAEKQSAFALVANGSAGSWDVALDEALSGPQRWFFQVDGPACYLYVQIKHPRVIENVLEFLAGGSRDGAKPSAGDNELAVSDSGGNSVRFLRDDESGGHCIILVTGKNEFCTRITLAREDVEAMRAALRQVRDELCAEGVLARAS